VSVLVWSVLTAATALVAGAAAGRMFVRGRRELGTAEQRASFQTLHAATLAAPSLRHGLTERDAQRSIRHLHALLQTSAVALTDRTSTLAWEGIGRNAHSAHAVELAAAVLQTGTTAVLHGGAVSCVDPMCPIRSAVVAAVLDRDTVVGALLAYAPQTSAPLVRAVEEVALWVSTQIELGGADRRQAQLVGAELSALRAQISPHFIYNSLTAIASFVRTDPDRARELLLEFADFSRYALRQGSEFTTLADELRNIERYLVLEQARFGERLVLSLRVAPEVLAVSVPYLVVQPLVENAVRHGLAPLTGVGKVSISAVDLGTEAAIAVEDNGVGADPETIRRALAGELGDRDESGDTYSASIGLSNVDTRLRHVYGDTYGLVIETAPNSGTKVSFRIPKFAPGIQQN
jgi:two-component system LytT family sensor kinase